MVCRILEEISLRYRKYLFVSSDNFSENSLTYVFFFSVIPNFAYHRILPNNNTKFNALTNQYINTKVNTTPTFFPLVERQFRVRKSIRLWQKFYAPFINLRRQLRKFEYQSTWVSRKLLSPNSNPCQLTPSYVTQPNLQIGARTKFHPSPKNDSRRQ